MTPTREEVIKWFEDAAERERIAASLTRSEHAREIRHELQGMHAAAARLIRESVPKAEVQRILEENRPEQYTHEDAGDCREGANYTDIYDAGWKCGEWSKWDAINRALARAEEEAKP